MGIGGEMHKALRAEWLEIEGGDPRYAGGYTPMVWVMHPSALAELRVEDGRGMAPQGFLRRVGVASFEFMGVPIRTTTDASGFELRKSN